MQQTHVITPFRLQTTGLEVNQDLDQIAQGVFAGTALTELLQLEDINPKHGPV